MLIDRMIRAARLEVPLYEEVERDTEATSQALIVVIIVAIAAGIGSAIAVPEAVIGGLVAGVLSAVLGWLVWSFVTYFIGTRLFAGTATWGEMLRAIGFAQSPGVLHIVRFVPVLGPLASLLVGIWQLIAGVIAVRTALDVDTGKAIFTVLIGWLAYLVVTIALFALLAVF